jgi:hypothetical protein
VADGSTPWIKPEWVDSTLEKLLTKNNNRFHFETSTFLQPDGSARTDQNKRVSYTSGDRSSKKKLDDVFGLVDHLMNVKGVKDFENIRQAVSDSRNFEDNPEYEPLQRFSYPLTMTPQPLERLPLDYEEERRPDIEATMMEMSNYAVKCMTDNYLYLDEHLNLDITELLPGEPPVEPSTDHTSSKKKERKYPQIEKELTPTDSGKNNPKFDNVNLGGKRNGQGDPERPFENDLIVRRRLMKTAGPSPPRAIGQSINLGEESVPKPFEIDKYLNKRTPVQDMQTMMPLKVAEMSYKKPTYVSRKASPPRIKATPPEMARTKESSKMAIEISTEQLGNGPKASAQSNEKLDSRVSQPTEPRGASSLTTEGQKQTQERTTGVPKTDQRQAPSQKPGLIQSRQQPQVQVEQGTRQRQLIEPREPPQVSTKESKKSEEKPDRPSMFNLNQENISKYLNLSNGSNALRNMSMPQKRAKDLLNK